jgi:hypothetical protein
MYVIIYFVYLQNTVSRSLQETETFLALLKESKKQLEGEVVGMGASTGGGGSGAAVGAASAGGGGTSQHPWLFSRQTSKPSLFSAPLVAHRRAKSLTTKVPFPLPLPHSPYPSPPLAYALLHSLLLSIFLDW